MALRSRGFDELKGILEEQDLIEYEEYFGEMELEDEEKEERKGLAKSLEALFLFYFLVLFPSGDTEPKTLIRDSYISLAASFLSVGKDSIPAYVSDHAEGLADDVIGVTKDNKSEYYTSQKRARLIAANEANAIGNYRQLIRAIEAGMTRKTWVTMRDKKVRKSHSEIDGKTIGILEMFDVGGSQMAFPKDASHGADAREIVNCRCVAKYSK